MSGHESVAVKRVLGRFTVVVDVEDVLTYGLYMVLKFDDVKDTHGYLA